MSGTSLDGLDIALCTFSGDENLGWSFTILKAETMPYTPKWIQTLRNLHEATAADFVKTDTAYATLLATSVNDFLKRHKEDVLLIASHGHTIFHAPGAGYTTQIGHGGIIAALTGSTVVSDFRSTDVALGGQGAPLVPLGDRFLFPEYDYCINLGGFANISFDTDGVRKAFDICPVNFVLNKIFKEQRNDNTEIDFDKDGALASSGRLNKELLEKLDNLAFYKNTGPKSLGREWVDAIFMPAVGNFDIPVSDKLHTISHHIAIQISHALNNRHGSRACVTGGGAYNTFLLNLIKHYASKTEIHVPEPLIVEYKEALIFAFLGLLRYHGLPNCLASVTGASNDSSSGAIYSGRR